MEVLDGFCGSKFWDLKVTWYTQNPDFTLCFERTVLVWIPCGFLWLVASYEIIYAINAKNYRRIPNSALNLIQRSVVLVIIAFQILELVNSYSYQTAQAAGLTISAVDQVDPVLKGVTYCLAVLLQTINQHNGIHSSGPLFIFWFLSAVCGAFEFESTLRNVQLRKHNIHDVVRCIIVLISYPLIVLEFLLNFFSDKRSVPILNKSESDLDDRTKGKSKKREHTDAAYDNPCPEIVASYPSKLTFHWFLKLAWLGYKKPLEFDDLWDLNPGDRSRPVIKHFLKFWKPVLLKAQKANSVNKESEKVSQKSYSKGDSESIKNSVDEDNVKSADRKSKQRSHKSVANVLPALFKAHWDVFLFGSFLHLVHDILNFVSPQILNLLIQHVSSTEERWKGYLYAATMFLTGMLQMLIISQYFHRVLIIGMRVRVGLIGAIYQKSLVISNAARKEFTLGEIVNLMSVDCQRFNDLTVYLNWIWSAPLQITLSVYFLWDVLGAAVFSGVAVLFLLIPVNGLLASKMKKLQIEQMTNKDERVKLMNEILSGIKVLKLYAWEPSFQDQINEIRQRELSVLRKSRILACINSLFWTLAPFMVSLSSFATYVLMDKRNILDARKAFVALTLFNIMRLPMTILPMLVVFAVETGVSLKRVNKFMNADEIDAEAVTHTIDSDDSTVVRVQNGNFTWGESEGDGFTLKDINLEVKKGSLVAIVGSVGSGKTSLLSAILGEMEKLNGTVSTCGSIAYVAQQAWIQNATLRNNILFGKDYSSKLYKKVLEVCALGPDLEMLVGGDQTEIGEKGINLSGGQKQRVSLARATYCGADLYLFDDPLSAVDSHVGKHLFENVIGRQGILKRKTRVIVTHGIHYLPYMDQVIVLNNGQISETGTFSELLDKKGAFADFLVHHATAEDLEHPDLADVRSLDSVLFVTQSNSSFKQFSKVSQTEKSGREAEEAYLSLRASRVSRVASQISKVTGFSKGEVENDKLIDEEKMEVGSVKLAVYRHYLKSIGWGIVIVTFIFNFLYSGLSLLTNIWLARWANEASGHGTQGKQSRDVYLGVYGGLGVCQAVALFCGQTALALGNLKAARFLHEEMLTHILQSPMSFFDTTPLGRIVNRFAKDVDVADSTFPENLRSWISFLFQVLSTLVVISYSTPWFLVLIVPIGVIYYAIQRFYVTSSRQLKRLESVSRSPIYSHFSETLAGSVSIRAFSKQMQFIRQFEHHVDHNQIANYPSIIANRWLATRLETLGSLIILFAAIFSVISVPDEGYVGLSVSYALNVTLSLNWLVRMTADVESNIVAVERIKEYGETPQEAAWEIPDKKPPSGWPQNGHIKFNGYQSRYREGLDLIIKDVSCDIEAGEKVGIVGRTGAGKSSLTLGLFRIVEAAGGSIEIDDLDLASMGLHDVRGNLTIIPQDPVLFSGTLRLNLDPFKRYTDSEIWHALEYSHLKQFVSSLPTSLEHEISEGGENLSVGQRQLVCLARALLRKTKILVLDEATAAVDLETDDLIQQTIRSEFKDCTVLTIAHRLDTIMDCNRVMVLDSGRIREFKNPQDLLTDNTTVFYTMAKDAGLV